MIELATRTVVVRYNKLIIVPEMVLGLELVTDIVGQEASPIIRTSENKRLL